MPTFAAPDGTRLAYRIAGDSAGPPLLCLAGGPLQDSDYLGTLGGLDAHRRLAILDLRGTGRSAVPEDPTSYRCDRLVGDVEAFRGHLGLDRMDVLAHSAGANLAVLHAARHPERVRRLALVAPSPRAVGIQITGEARRWVARLRSEEPWFPHAFTALEAVTAGQGSAADWDAIAPFFHGRWDAAAKELQAATVDQKNAEGARIFASDGAFDPAATRASLAGLTAQVEVFAGEFDLHLPPREAAELAQLFPGGSRTLLPEAGHYPWCDDPGRFVAALAAFLAP